MNGTTTWNCMVVVKTSAPVDVGVGGFAATIIVSSFKLFRCLALVYFSCFRGVKNLTSRASCAERDRDVSTVTPVTR